MNVLERLDALERAVAEYKLNSAINSAPGSNTFKYSRVKPLNTSESINRLNKIVGIEEDDGDSHGLQNLQKLQA